MAYDGEVQDFETKHDVLDRILDGLAPKRDMEALRRQADADRAEARDILIKARDLLARPRGWCQVSFEELIAFNELKFVPTLKFLGLQLYRPKVQGNYTRAFCAVGAIQHVAGERHMAAYRAKVALANVIAGYHTNSQAVIFDYNDKSCRSQKQVVAMMDKAIKRMAA